MRLSLVSIFFIACAAFWPLQCHGAEPLQMLTEENPPVSFLQDGAPTGLCVELVQEMLRRQGLDAPIDILPWARAYAIAIAKPNVGLFATGRFPHREKAFHWVGPLASLNLVLVAHKSRHLEIKTLEDARHYHVGVIRDDGRTKMFEDLGFTNLQPVASEISNLEKLIHGRIDLWSTSSLAMPHLIRQAESAMGHRHGDELEIVYVGDSVDLYLAFSNATGAAIVDGFRKALLEMRADGAFARISARWLARADR